MGDMNDTMGFTDSAPPPPEQTGPPGLAGATASEPTPQEQHARQERQPVLGIVLVGVAVVMVAGALVAGILGLDARAAADDARARARTFTHRATVQERARDEAVDRRRVVNERADAVYAALESLTVALRDSATAQRLFSEHSNRGADVWNTGDLAGSEDIYRGDVASALNELSVRQDELRAALAALHAARDELEGVLR
jgi:hypothetical protein